MSQKTYEDGPVKMTASTSPRGRFTAVLGLLSAMVRGGRRKDARRIGLAGGIAVPQGVSVTPTQTVPVAGGDLRLVR